MGKSIQQAGGMSKADKREKKFVTGYRPVVRAREGRMLGIRQPLDGPVLAPWKTRETRASTR
jgi:hypothetical protein